MNAGDPGHNNSADRNLLIGVLALQMDFIRREDLIAATSVWLLDKTKGLDQILLERQALQPDEHALLVAVVAKHLARHDGDPRRSLAALNSINSMHDELQRLGDAELSESLSHVSSGAACDLSLTVGHAIAVIGVESAARGAVPDESRFRVLRPHAEGGLGRVSVAHDEELHREVALKEIKPQYATDVDRRNRFTLEAEITGALEHPGVVPVYGLGKYSDGRPYYAMRFIRGNSLRESIEHFHAATRAKIAKGEQISTDVNTQTLVATAPTQQSFSLPSQAARPISREAFVSVEFRKLLGRIIDVCQTIEYAHSRGVLHRDLKPSNIMLGHYGETLVVDWGLAKAEGKSDWLQSSEGVPQVPSSGSMSEPTEVGTVIGTPAYMSPEQASSRLDEIGPATDVYSLGATLYHVLTGRPPFAKQPIPDMLAWVKRGQFTRPRELNPHVPKALEAICLKAMSLQPKDRYAAAREIAEDLERWLGDEPVVAHREGPLAQGLRFIRKRRAWAMSGAAALMLVALVATVSALWINWQKQIITKQERSASDLADRNASLAIEKSKLAEREKAERKKAERNADAARRQTKLAERHLYAAHMNLAQSGWEDARISQTARLLDLYRPVAAQQGGSDDLRGFEWYYWDRCCHSALLTLNAHSGMVDGVAFSPDGQHLASASSDQTVKLWDANTGHESLTLKGHAGVVRGVAFSPDGRRLASASNDQTIKVWHVGTGQDALTLKGHTSAVMSVAFSPDGRRLASTSLDQSVKVWDAATGEATLTLLGHLNAGTSVAFSPDGKRLASASVDKTVKVWDVDTGQEMFTFKGHSTQVLSVAFSPNGQRLASAGQDHMVKLWDADTGQESLTLKGHTSAVTSVAFSLDGQRLASASQDETIKVWDADTGEESLTLKGHTAPVLSVAFSPNGMQLASASGDQTVKVWDPTTSQESIVLKGNLGAMMSVAFSSDGKRLASASFDHTIRICDAATGRELLTLKGHSAPVWCVAFSPVGQRLASASLDQTLKIWDAASGQELLTLKGHTAETRSVAFSPDGQRLVSASSDRTIRIWNLVTGQELLTLKGHSAEIRGVAFSPDGRWVASASLDRTVRVWDPVTGQEWHTLQGHTAPIWSVAFSKDGQWLASASFDQTVKLWDVTTGQESLTLKGHTAGVTSTAFSPDGQRLASASSDRTVKVWDVITGQESLTLKGHTAPVWSVTFSPNGKQLASASGDQTVRVWNATP